MELLTKQKANEILVVYKEVNGSSKRWYALLCPYKSAPWSVSYKDMNQKKITDFNWQIVEYRSQNGETSKCSGSGDNPPKQILDLLSTYGELIKI